jgi:hypothetical protein
MLIGLVTSYRSLALEKAKLLILLTEGNSRIGNITGTLLTRKHSVASSGIFSLKITSFHS